MNMVKYGKALYADLLRLALLYKYGGIWNDATCYVTRQIPEEILNNPLFFFRIEAMMPCYPLAFENWYIRAEKRKLCNRENLGKSAMLFGKRNRINKNISIGFTFNIQYT